MLYPTHKSPNLVRSFSNITSASIIWFILALKSSTYFFRDVCNISGGMVSSFPRAFTYLPSTMLYVLSIVGGSCIPFGGSCIPFGGSCIPFGVCSKGTEAPVDVEIDGGDFRF